MRLTWCFLLLQFFQYWKNVSNDAKDFIRKMLTLDPEKRLTAKEALQHAWVTEDDDRLASNDLKSNLQQLKLFHARRKFKSTIRTVLLTNRLSKVPHTALNSVQGSPVASRHRIQRTLSSPLTAAPALE